MFINFISLLYYAILMKNNQAVSLLMQDFYAKKKKLQLQIGVT